MLWRILPDASPAHGTAHTHAPQNRIGQAECFPCAAGTYSSAPASAACERCPPHSMNILAGMALSDADLTTVEACRCEAGRPWARGTRKEALRHRGEDA